ncbi:transcriptional protein SWT1 [Wyeomyia smithii]|uniref:transcriptional protein SWT1 n=1 Tax=Wyeomyia smithii TaxID=174621 RepID=UPI002467CD03|nr:transcriptional protein SWT1 [Wyeomyia smithii]
MSNERSSKTKKVMLPKDSTEARPSSSTSAAASPPATSGSTNGNPLPPHWSKIASKKRTGLFYYFNSETRESTWDHPAVREAEEQIIRPKLGAKVVPKKSTEKVVQLKNDTQFKKKNLAKSRMETLQKQLELERKLETIKNSCVAELKNKKSPQKTPPTKKVTSSKNEIKNKSEESVTPSDSKANFKIAPKNSKVVLKQSPTKVAKQEKTESLKRKSNEAVNVVQKPVTLLKPFKIPKKPSLQDPPKLQQNERIQVPVSTQKTDSPLETHHEEPPEVQVSLPTRAALSPNIPTCPPLLASTPKIDQSLPTLKSPANERLSLIRAQLAEGIGLLPDEDTEMTDLSGLSELPSLVAETMDWEDIPEELAIREIVALRQAQKLLPPPETEASIPRFQMPLFDGINFQRFFFVVLDTNIFLSHLKGLEEMLSTFPAAAGQPILVVPYIVLQELDRIKHREQGKSLGLAASHSIRFLNERLRKRDPRVKGQSTLEANQPLIEITNPDDNIVNCCLQVREAIVSSNPTTELLLLSNDVNLRNKMLVNGVQALSYAELLAEADKLRLAVEDSVEAATEAARAR